MSDSSKIIRKMWLRRIRAYKQSGQSQREFCRENGFKLSTFQRWLGKLDWPDPGQRPEGSRQKPEIQKGERPQGSFSKVKVNPASGASDRFILYFGNGMRLECGELPSPEWIVRLGVLS